MKLISLTYFLHLTYLIFHSIHSSSLYNTLKTNFERPSVEEAYDKLKMTKNWINTGEAQIRVKTLSPVTVIDRQRQRGASKTRANETRLTPDRVIFSGGSGCSEGRLSVKSAGNLSVNSRISVKSTKSSKSIRAHSTATNKTKKSKYSIKSGGSSSGGPVNPFCPRDLNSADDSNNYEVNLAKNLKGQIVVRPSMLVKKQKEMANYYNKTRRLSIDNNQISANNCHQNYPTARNTNLEDHLNQSFRKSSTPVIQIVDTFSGENSENVMSKSISNRTRPLDINLKSKTFDENSIRSTYSDHNFLDYDNEEDDDSIAEREHFIPATQAPTAEINFDTECFFSSLKLE